MSGLRLSYLTDGKMIVLWVIWPGINSVLHLSPLVNEVPSSTWGCGWDEGEPWKSSLLCSGTIFQCLIISFYINILSILAVITAMTQDVLGPWKRDVSTCITTMAVMTALLSGFRIWDLRHVPWKIRANMKRGFLISSVPTVTDTSGTFFSNVLKPPLDKYWGLGWNLPPPFPIGSKLH